MNAPSATPRKSHVSPHISLTNDVEVCSCQNYNTRRALFPEIVICQKSRLQFLTFDELALFLQCIQLTLLLLHEGLQNALQLVNRVETRLLAPRSIFTCRRWIFHGPRGIAVLLKTVGRNEDYEGLLALEKRCLGM